MSASITGDATSESPSVSAQTSSSPPVLLTLADACPKVQDALDSSFKGEGFSTDPLLFREFAGSIALLAEQTDPKGRNILETLAETSEQVAQDIEGAADGLESLEAVDPWFTDMDRITQVCEDQGAPLK